MRSHLCLVLRSQPLCFAVARIFVGLRDASADAEGHPPKLRYSPHLVVPAKPGAGAVMGKDPGPPFYVCEGAGEALSNPTILYGKTT